MCNGVRERIRIPYGDALLSVTISMGIASFPLQGTNSAEVLKNADNALYEAKHAGRDQVVVSAVQQNSSFD
ncbi:MAG: diguanylate cyclase [Nitrospirae bacterium]|nr:diguanylate cyclase [Nitrospirota bacterium]